MSKNTIWMMAALGLAGFAGTGCALFKGKEEKTPVRQEQAMAKGIYTTISIAKQIRKGTPVLLSAVVQNTTKESFRFLKWNSPFEKAFLADYLDIMDAAGNKIPYQGAMAKRMWPPPADAYVTVTSGQTVKSSIDITKAYPVNKPGTYTVKFTGQNGEDALPASNTVTFTIGK